MNLAFTAILCSSIGNKLLISLPLVVLTLIFLIEFYGEISSINKFEEYSLSDLFPDAKGKVFASWFTGDITIPLGKPANYNHLNTFGVIYEYTTTLKFHEGVVIDSGTFLL
jgi:hypothetical protein